MGITISVNHNYSSDKKPSSDKVSEKASEKASEKLNEEKKHVTFEEPEIEEAEVEGSSEEDDETSAEEDDEDEIEVIHDQEKAAKVARKQADQEYEPSVSRVDVVCHDPQADPLADPPTHLPSAMNNAM